MQQRYYEPLAGRFLSVDPVVTDAKTGGSFNRYAYGSNNPYRFTDPDGRDPISRLPYEVGVPGIGGMGGGAVGGGGGRGGVGTGGTGGVSGGAAAAGGRAPILGNAQVTRSGGSETTHASTSTRVANDAAKAADATRVHMNQTIKTVTDGQSNSAVRPDVATVRADGKINVTEVLSPGQSAAAAIQKNEKALGSLAGDIKAIPSDPKPK